jgi:hypothetical protein
MKRIRISAGYDTSENLTERLLKQFKTDEIDLSNVEFVFDNSYDIIIFFNHIVGDYDKNKKAYVFPHEPTWAGTHQKNYLEYPNLTVFGFDKNIYQGNCIESIAHTYYGGRGPWVDKLDFWSYDNLKQTCFSKKRSISSSITDINNNSSSTCLYPPRYELGKYINENLKFINIYGGWNNDLSHISERKESLIDYKFNLIVENEYYNNWITEKFYDCVLTDTIPIYFGCKNIKELYPEDGYILINDINNVKEIDELLTHIHNNVDEIYNSKIENLKQIKNKYFIENNLLKKIITL